MVVSPDRVVRRTVPAMARAPKDRETAAAHRRHRRRPKRSGGPGGRENLERSDREEAPDATHGGRGNFPARAGLDGAVRSLALGETSREWSALTTTLRRRPWQPTVPANQQTRRNGHPEH